ncbi:MAG: RNA-binding protein [Herminiimonas sp.]|nr:RNA-binding protein [Herminiimonas sp.]
MSDSTRLAKHLAQQINCSRREAELYIEGGWVTVDGEVVEEPGFRLGQQSVVLAPDATLAPLPSVTILLHKPAGIDGTSAEGAALGLIRPEAMAADDRSGIRFLKRHVSGLTLAAPLTANASGLMVWTQDWRVARKLVEDAARIEHEFIVEVSGAIMPDGLAMLNAGTAVPGRPNGPVKVSWQNETHLRFALKANSAAYVSQMCSSVNLMARSIRRIRIGRISMASLGSGQWRYLLGYERF